MADYFTSMSFEFTLPSEEAAKSAIRLLRQIDDLVVNIVPEDWPPDLKHLAHLDCTSECSIEAQGSTVWVSDDAGSASVDVLVEFLQEVLRRFMPDGSIGFEWANTCSRSRLDAFGGGAVLVTLDDAKWMNTGSWLSAARKDLEQAATKGGA